MMTATEIRKEREELLKESNEKMVALIQISKERFWTQEEHKEYIHCLAVDRTYRESIKFWAEMEEIEAQRKPIKFSLE